LRWPSNHRFTEEHVQAFIERITAPTLGFLADRSVPPDNPWIQQRLAPFRDIELVQVPGHHHVHLDSPGLLAPKILDFLRR
jgi:pimeloyl-ACP methyl ester carboxylesterase